MLLDRKSTRPAELAFDTVSVFTCLALSCSGKIILTQINNAADKYLVQIPPFNL